MADPRLPGNFLPKLRGLLDSVNTEVHSCSVLKLGHDEAFAKVSETMADRRTQNADLERKIEAVTARYKQRKSEYDSAHRDKMSSIESMQDDIVQMHERLSAQTAEWARQREAAEMELEAVRNMLRSERDTLSTIVTGMAETVVTHKHHVQECIAAYKATIAEVKQS
mmetsp:Transcript_6095/g.15576  ORF Transcript_6095/g.15576 Transcript_6095/m.15576 type:complete len:167 (-) Transcript_6095:31-531(-)